MPLPNLNLPREFEVPAREAKEYTSAFLTEMLIRADPNNKWFMRLKLMPYDAETNELGPIAGISMIQIGDLLSESERSPVVAQALGNVWTVLSYLIDEKRGLTKLAEGNKELQDANELVDSDELKSQAIANANAKITEALQIIATAKANLGVQDSSSSSSSSESSSSST